MRRSLLGVIYRKELLDSLRDRRALISMIVVPLVVIPLLVIGLGGLSYTLTERAEAEVYDVMVLGAESAPALVAELEQVETIRLVPEREDFGQRIADRRLAAAVSVPPDYEERLRDGRRAEITVYTFEGEMRSAIAAQRVEAVLHRMQRELVRERLAVAGLEEEAIRPFALERRNVAPPERVTGALLGGVLPYLLIVLCITGAIYPAMDLTAGEKERGTMETLLSSPASRVTIVLGKFLVVLTFSAVTALLAVSALGGTFWFAMTQLRDLEAGVLDLAIRPLAIFGVLILLVPVAALFSAILVALSVFARTFKEAQTYVSPLILVAVMPAVVGLMPGVRITAGLALVPVLNVSLIAREVLSGFYEWGYIIAVLASSSLYAGIALLVAVYLFQKESVIFRA